MKLKEFIPGFARQMAIVHINESALTHWPCSVMNLYNATDDYLLPWIEKITNTAKQNKTLEEMARAMHGPTKISQFLPVFINPQQRKLVNAKQLTKDWITMIEYYRKDPLCQDHQNQILTHEQIQGKTKQNFLNENQDLKHIRLLLWAYTEYIHPMLRGFCFEAHGEYHLNKNQNLVVKEFYDLRPTEVLPHTNAFPFSQITLTELVNPGTFKTDFLGHINTKIPLKTAIKTSQPIENKQELEQFRKQLETAIERIIEENDTKYFLTKAIEGTYYALKPICDIAGLDWKPSEEQCQKIKQYKIKDYSRARTHTEEESYNRFVNHTLNPW